MDRDKNNIIQQQQSDSDSAYIGIDGSEPSLDFDGLFSHQFANIKQIYCSPQGPAEIYTATRYGKRFVLKTLKKEYRTDPIYTIGLVKEFEIGIQLDHNNIRRTIGLEEVENIGNVIVLEYVDGDSLEGLIRSGNITVPAARSIVRQIAGALHYIHSKHMFHRDLKPSNILISHHANVVKIIDFNLSDSDDFIVLKNPAGSRKYMAPEQFNADAVPSAVADIYSFGVIMSELAAVTGDGQLAQIGEKCMNTDPDKRPQSVDQIKLPSSVPSLTDKLSDFLSSKILTYIMLLICLALVAAITFQLINNF